MELPTLRFSPSAWAKLLYLRDIGPTEIGGFGIAATADLLFVEDILLVAQDCSPVSVAFDDNAVADFFDDQIDRGLLPAQFARIWIHTHPGNSAEPSLTDEETFDHVFSPSDWAVMFILARGGRNYARLRFNVGPSGEIEIPVEIDYRYPFAGSDHAAWEREYQANIHSIVLPQFPRDQLRPLGLPAHNSEWEELHEFNRIG